MLHLVCNYLDIMFQFIVYFSNLTIIFFQMQNIKVEKDLTGKLILMELDFRWV